MRLLKDSADYKIWLDSYRKEHDGLQDLNTYDVIDTAEMLRLKREHDVDPIPTMCIHNVKPDSQGRPDCTKSWTMVLGNEEHRCWEKTDLFAPVIARHSVRALVAFGLWKGRMTKQCNAKNAFCHPTLPDDKICVVSPPKGCPFPKRESTGTSKRHFAGSGEAPVTGAKLSVGFCRA